MTKKDRAMVQSLWVEIHDLHIHLWRVLNPMNPFWEGNAKEFLAESRKRIGCCHVEEEKEVPHRR